MTQRIRPVTHYIIFPTALGGVPIPMKRFKYQPVDANGKSLGSKTYYTANQLQPNARKSVDGSLMVIGLELEDIFTAIAELANFPHKDQLQVLSHKEATALMRTPEWTETDNA